MSRRVGAIDDPVRVYLRDVEIVLRQDGVSADDIESVCSALETQILDMAGERGTATGDSIALAIASMDPPASFGSAVEQSTADNKGASSQLAFLSFVVAVSGPPLAIIAGVVASLLGYEGWEFGSFILFALSALALLFGAIVWRTPRGRAAIKLAVGTITAYFVLIAVVVAFA